MVMHGPIWPHMALSDPYGPFGSVWSCMFLYGPVWSCMVQHGPLRPIGFHRAPYCQEWFFIVSYVPIWPVWSHMAPYGPVGAKMILNGSFQAGQKENHEPYKQNNFFLTFKGVRAIFNLDFPKQEEVGKL